jgi:hypothetical protein
MARSEIGSTMQASVRTTIGTLVSSNRTQTNSVMRSYAGPAPRARWPNRALVGVTFIMIALSSCRVGRHADSLSSGAVSSAHALSPMPNTPRAGSPMPRLSGDFEAFDKSWSFHEGELDIGADGHGKLTWRLERSCGQEPPPCSTTTRTGIIGPGRATVILKSRRGATASGHITRTSAPSSIARGPVVLRLDTHHRDVMYLTMSPGGQFPSGKLTLCGPDATTYRPCN